MHGFISVKIKKILLLPLLLLCRNATVAPKVCILQLYTLLPPQPLNEEASNISSWVTTIVDFFFSFAIHSIGIISNYITILSSTSCLNSCSSSSSLLSSFVRNYSSSSSISSSPSSSSLYGREEETQQHCQTYKEDKACTHS